MACLVERATEQAERDSLAVKQAAEKTAHDQIGADLQRLVDLARVNDHVRPEEIKLAQTQLKKTCGAIREARLRLDALRLVVAGFAA